MELIYDKENLIELLKTSLPENSLIKLDIDYKNDIHKLMKHSGKFPVEIIENKETIITLTLKDFIELKE